LQTMDRYQVNVTGSNDGQAYLSTMQGLVGRRMNAQQVQEVINNTANPVSAMFIAYQALGQNKQFLKVHETINTKLQSAMPESQYAKDYTSFITRVANAKAPAAAAGPISVGQVAPDIALPSPDGKTYKLSDLKGQVVLLDFWASWCGPCRRENPNVVNVYKKYKEKGFTVFSVSLDGIDSRSAARYGGDQAKLDKAMDSQKQRWVGAIKQDNLIWDTHVSDLKKWECAPAKEYGVRGIPKTFLIDKEGKVAKMGLRGHQLEQEVLKLL